MVSLSLLSRSGSRSSLGGASISDEPFTLIESLAGASASSSKSSLLADDDENVTITANRALPILRREEERSTEDLRLLAVSTHMTELSYSISDIQTRIFEIQELRHQSQGSSDTPASSTGIIDQALMNLDEKLEAVNTGMKAINESIEPLLASANQTPKQSSVEEVDEHAALMRKHVTLVADWEAVQDESDVLREELKEDKWLTVFRTVSEQADGMMSSLEKAVKRCQDFIWQVHRRGNSEDSQLSTPSYTPKAPVNYETFSTLIDSFEAKKKHYMPATTKVLAIIDKGVQDRVTKNGECLRRHAESTDRWKSLRERITRTELEMETVRRLLLGEPDPSETGSTTSKTSKSSSAKHRNGFLATPPASEPSRSRAPSQSTTLSRSISPFRKFARKLGGGSKTPARAAPTPISRHPSSEPPVASLRNRSSLFFRGSQAMTPERPTHKYSQSLTPESSPTIPRRIEDTPSSTVRIKPPRWNSSTKVESEEGTTTMKQTPPRRPSVASIYASHGTPGNIPPVPPLPRPYSRSSMASSRPWSPVTSSASTTAPSTFSPPSHSRPPSRAQSPFGTTPRTRPKTPSHIPAPIYWRSLSSSASDASFEDTCEPSSLMQRAMSPTFSATSAGGRARTPSNGYTALPRPPSRSMIPIPSFHFSSASRPSSAMSNHDRPGSSMSFRSSAHRAQTPESALRARVSQLPFHQDPARGTPSRSSVTPRPRPRAWQHKLPPSSFREASASSSTTGSSSYSRPSSRAGASTPGFDGHNVYKYTPVSLKDPLDVEVANIVNSTAHGLLVERVDPPLRVVPKENEEVKGQYAFSNQLARKVVTCRLTTISRSGTKAHAASITKKVMCRVGGGWQDLQLYMLNRQAGM